MKRLRRMLSIIFFIGAVLCAPVQAIAMGFDAETIYESIVIVHSDSLVGSGFAISEHKIVTNAHVMANADAVSIQTYAGEKYDADVEAIDTALDIAVLNIKDKSFVPLKTADEALSKVGDDVYVVGAPSSMAYSLTKGVLSAKNREIGSRLYLQTDAAINFGNSGGPLLNENGEVLGMNTLKLVDSEGIGLAISMKTIEDYLDSSEDGIALPPVKSDSAVESLVLTYIQNSNLVLIILLCLSGILNITLVTVLVYGKMRSSKCEPNASERTDFEIDILE
ncbi:hypothetical protein AGMMS49957_15210 [Synergistales bacterium]|nr:hypothetical protein AGMMS49957_15210 [Synergistales bacterium]